MIMNVDSLITSSGKSLGPLTRRLAPEQKRSKPNEPRKSLKTLGNPK
jgi:hypothetical protein